MKRKSNQSFFSEIDINTSSSAWLLISLRHHILPRIFREPFSFHRRSPKPSHAHSYKLFHSQPGSLGRGHVSVRRALHAPAVFHREVAVRGCVVHPLSILAGCLRLHFNSYFNHHCAGQICGHHLSLQSKNAG